MLIIPGAAAFLLFLLGDLNDAFWQRRWLKPSFICGAVLLSAATVMTLLGCFPRELTWWSLLFLAAAVFFGLLMIWALFFSFPAGQTYVDPSSRRSAFTGGMYALCRHPGVVWFCLMYACLIPAVGFPMFPTAVLCGLNCALVWIEDRWIFPEIFDNYAEYKIQTPFLIPTPRSIRSWITSSKRRKERG